MERASLLVGSVFAGCCLLVSNDDGRRLWDDDDDDDDNKDNNNSSMDEGTPVVPIMSWPDSQPTSQYTDGK